MYFYTMDQLWPLFQFIAYFTLVTVAGAVFALILFVSLSDTAFKKLMKMIGAVK